MSHETYINEFNGQNSKKEQEQESYELVIHNKTNRSRNNSIDNETTNTRALSVLQHEKNIIDESHRVVI